MGQLLFRSRKQFRLNPADPVVLIGQQRIPYTVLLNRRAFAFLRNPAAFDLGRKVIVIGGGNVAMDASRAAVRQILS